MKSLRRSLGTKDSHNSNGMARISTPLAVPIISKPQSSAVPPTQVIKATQDYRPQAPHELGFSVGDFFHVIRDVDRGGVQWYEAHNPITGARGLVPQALFEVFNKSDALRVSTVAAGPRNAISTAMRSPAPSASGSGKTAFYAIVVHDFAAERPDELDARAGDAISVVAQSNREWFVAKPIGKLGRPGLIPISFVEMRDPMSGSPIRDVNALLDRGDIPLVDEWKRAMNQYKAASIPLGVIDDPGYGPVPNSPFTPAAQNNMFGTQQQQEPRGQYPSPPSSSGAPPTHLPTPSQSQPQREEDTYKTPPALLPEGILYSAEVLSFHFENREYWFRINATFQPEDPASGEALPALQMVLYRVYEDFYDFQITLLDTFPVEAGRQPDPDSEDPASPTRILPYMPGPVATVDALITSERRIELDEYVRALAVLRDCGAEHILRHPLIRKFFAPRAGDTEVQIPPVLQPGLVTNGASQSHVEAEQEQERDDYVDDMQALQVGDADVADDGRQYYDYDRDREDETQRQFPVGQPAAEVRSASRLANGSRTRQDSASQRPPSAASHSRTISPRPGGGRAPQSQWNGYSQYSEGGDSINASYGGGRPESAAGSASIAASGSANAPPISASNPQPAFVKIKIFDRATDDLIAIRVPPRVTHRQLMDKTRERLGGDVAALRFRNSLTGQLEELDEDGLRHWLETADKLVLYAD